MLPRLQRLVAIMRLRRWLIARLWRLIAGRLIPAVTVAGAEGTLRAVLGRAVAVVVEVDRAEIAVGFGEMSAGLVLRARSTAHQVRVAVGTRRNGCVVVKVESVVTTHAS